MPEDCGKPSGDSFQFSMDKLGPETQQATLRIFMQVNTLLQTALIQTLSIPKGGINDDATDGVVRASLRALVALHDGDEFPTESTEQLFNALQEWGLEHHRHEKVRMLYVRLCSLIKWELPAALKSILVALKEAHRLNLTNDIDEINEILDDFIELFPGDYHDALRFEEVWDETQFAVLYDDFYYLWESWSDTLDRLEKQDDDQWDNIFEED